MLFVIIAQLLLGLKINYPPLPGQLIGSVNVWFIRIVALVVSSFLIYIWGKKWQKFILVLSPIYWVLWYCYPLILAELIIWVFAIEKIKKNKWWIGLLVVMCFVRMNMQEGKIAIIEKIMPVKLTEQITERVKNEDILTYKVNLPLKFRRLAYNKPVFAMKNIMQESIKFLDVETVFFGEFHPLEQKGMVVYYWPETFLLVVGVFFYLKSKKRKDLGIYLFCSFIYFLVSKESNFLRFGMLWVTLSFFMAIAFQKINVYWRILAVAVLIYSFGVNGSNFLFLKAKWFDNRPLVMEYCFRNLPKNGDNYVTRVFGNELKYCKYYNNNCVLNEDINKATNVCVFAGELVERVWNNSIVSNWQGLWDKKGYEIKNYIKTYDSVAFGYSDYLVIGEKK